jgi:hypothetical protein
MGSDFASSSLTATNRFCVAYAGASQFNGAIDELKIWTRALALDNIQMVYRNQYCDHSQLAVYYRFENNGDGSILYDWSGNGQHATVVGTIPVWSNNASHPITAVATRFTCTCPSSFSGSTCQLPVPCAAAPCRNNATCTHDVECLLDQFDGYMNFTIGPNSSTNS